MVSGIGGLVFSMAMTHSHGEGQSTMKSAYLQLLALQLLLGRFISFRSIAFFPPTLPLLYGKDDCRACLPLGAKIRLESICLTPSDLLFRCGEVAKSLSHHSVV